MEFHVAVVAERAARAYAQTLEVTPASRFYGEPREAVLEILRRQGGAGVPMTVKRHHLAAFTRARDWGGNHDFGFLRHARERKRVSTPRWRPVLVFANIGSYGRKFERRSLNLWRTRNSA
jgi:hypothetical protein